MTAPTAREALAEIMRLARAAGDTDRRHCIGKAQGFDVRDAYAELEACARAALAAPDADKRDAERYRFIRDADRSDPHIPDLSLYAMESLDDYIDYAMLAASPKQEKP